MSIQRNYEYLSIIVRTKDGSRFVTLTNSESSSMNNVELAAQVYPDLKIDHFENCQSTDAREHIKTFDDKLEIQKFKFGVIYQKKGQVNRNNRFHLTFFLFVSRQRKKNFLITTNRNDHLKNFSIKSRRKFRWKISKGSVTMFFFFFFFIRSSFFFS